MDVAQLYDRESFERRFQVPDRNFNPLHRWRVGLVVQLDLPNLRQQSPRCKKTA
jgi:hypothetical protein